MGDEAGYTVGDVARMAGVTVRTLHHYDEIDLVPASQRTDAGYRSYTGPDLERLHRVLGYRELGFRLNEIAAIVDDPDADAVDHLRRQHELLTARIDRLRRLSAAVDRALKAHQMGISLDPHEMLEVFGDNDPTEHADEARERWGDTDAYAESQRRTSQYTKDDWLRMKQERTGIEQRFAQALTSGVAADSPEAMDVAEAHRRHIGAWFYDCPHAMHRGLADMYVADPRFTQHYEDIAEGLAIFVRDAVHANADRAAG